MKSIYVAKPFKLLGGDGKHTDFPVGMHKVTDEVADHWFVKHHLGDPSNAPAEPNAVQLAEIERAHAALEAEAKRLAELRDELNGEATKLDIRAADLDARATALASKEQELGARVAEFEVAQRAAAEKGAASKAAGSGKKT